MNLHNQALEFLKAAGADLNLARVDGATALDLAIDQEHSETVPLSTLTLILLRRSQGGCVI